MKYIYPLYKYFTIALIVLLAYSCVKDNFDVREKFSNDIKWNPSIALPLAYGHLTLGNIVKERKDTIQHISEKTLGYGSQDSDLVIQLRYGLDSARKIEILCLPVMQPYDTTLYLKPIQLLDAHTEFDKKVGELLQDNFSNTDYSDYQNYEAMSPPPLTVTERTADKVETYSSPTSPFTVIEYAVISEGNMEVICTNNFTVPFTADIAVLTDSAGIRQEITVFNFSSQWINPGSSMSDVFTFDHTYLGSQLFYEYRNMKFADASNVTVDLNNTIDLDIHLTNLKASQGKAVVPQQTITMDSLVYVTIRDKDESKKTYKIIVDEGLIHYKITSSMQVATEFFVIFESMKYQNDTVTKNAALNRFHPVEEADWFLQDLEADLTKNPDQPYNSIPIRLGYKVYTGTELMEFGPQQNLNIQISNPDSIVFRYLEGNMGKIEEDVFEDSIDFQIEDFLKNFLSGEITFYDPKLRIVYHNPVGIPGKFKMNIVGTNSKGESVSALKENANMFTIHAPTCDMVKNGDVIISNIEFNKNSSNIVDFIRLMPNKIAYSGKYLLNFDEPDENSIVNCVSKVGNARLTVEVELPMKLSIKDLVLRQEVPLSQIPEIENITNIESLRLFVYTENQLPLDVKLKITMLDTTLVGAAQELGVLDVIVLESGSTINGKVARNSTNKHTEEIVLTSATDSRLEKFLQSNKLRLEVLVETDQQGNVPVIFYTYYGLKFNLAVDGKFLYEGKLNMK